MLTYDVSHRKISGVRLRCCACLLCPGAAVGEGCAGSLAGAWKQLRWLLLISLEEEKGLLTLPWRASPCKEGRRSRCRGRESSLASSLWLYEQNSLSEPCRASPEECCKRWCSTKLQNKEQGASMVVPPLLFPSLLNVR